jgi:hypothetical protein
VFVEQDNHYEMAIACMKSVSTKYRADLLSFYYFGYRFLSIDAMQRKKAHTRSCASLQDGAGSWD